ncbi:MAG: hypothetical protein AAF577_16000 [Pseudomonadota bacterium]
MMLSDGLPRSPLIAFAGERLPGIGHNEGPPLDPGRSGRVFAWKKARAQLMPRLPLEVVRRRVRRARELGLTYPDYASILLGSGRDVIGFLFTGPALVERLRRGEAPMAVIGETRLARLREIQGAERRLLGAEAMAAPHPDLFALTAPAPAPEAEAPWREGRAAVLTAIGAAGTSRALPSDGVVMIGASPEERVWADAAALAKFLPAERYFAPLPS